MKRSTLWAGLFALAAIGWLASGEIDLRADGSRNHSATTVRKEGFAVDNGEKNRQPFRVEVIRATVEPWRDTLILPARSEAAETVIIRARTTGTVEKTPVEEGAKVRKGGILCRLDMADRRARLDAARAALESARHDYEAGRKLYEAGHLSDARLKQLRSLYEQARANVAQLELDITYTEVRAPFSGILSRQIARTGALLAPGDPCAELVRLDPLKIVASASERESAALKKGMRASAELVTGQRLSGRLTYIAPQADSATRTFRVEMKAANPEARARAGVTASLRISLPPRPSALLPLTAIGLNDDGILGVHVVRPDDTVEFLPVEVLRQGRDGARVAGVPDGARVIVTGQYYVLPGQKVEPVPFRPARKEKRS